MFFETLRETDTCHTPRAISFRGYFTLVPLTDPGLMRYIKRRFVVHYPAQSRENDKRRESRRLPA